MQQISGLGMAIFLAIFLAIWSAPLWAKTIEKTFVNPGHSCSIVYRGEEYRGEGSFFLRDQTGLHKITDADIFYGPRVTWYDNDIAEIFIPHGSPFHASWLFNAKTRKLGSFRDNVINVFPALNIFVYGTWEELVFAEISSEKIVQIIKIDGFNGSVFALRHSFDISIQKNKIVVGLKIEPHTYKFLDQFVYYEYAKSF